MNIMKNLLFILVSIFIIVILKLYFDKCLENYENDQEKQDNQDKEKKILGLTKNNWGWISVVTNGLSVIIQMVNLYATKSAQSFSMKFIFLMALLNFTYFIIGIINNNVGLAIATFMFVIYNLTVVYYFYFGKK